MWTSPADPYAHEHEHADKYAHEYPDQHADEYSDNRTRHEHADDNTPSNTPTFTPPQDAAAGRSDPLVPDDGAPRVDACGGGSLLARRQ